MVPLSLAKIASAPPDVGFGGLNRVDVDKDEVEIGGSPNASDFETSAASACLSSPSEWGGHQCHASGPGKEPYLHPPPQLFGEFTAHASFSCLFLTSSSNFTCHLLSNGMQLLTHIIFVAFGYDRDLTDRFPLLHDQFVLLAFRRSNI